jgi:diamine N-acetyltransferase
MATFNIRKALASEALKLRDFGEQEFVRTFGYLYVDCQDDYEVFKAQSYSEKQYLEWITNSDYLVSSAYIVSDDGSEKLVGYALGGPCGLPLEGSDGFNETTALHAGELKRLYVLPETFGTGIAQTLLTEVMQFLRKDEANAGRDIYLGVYSENPRAQSFYAKNNFKKVGEYSFMVGTHADREFLMKNSVSSL